MILDILNIGGKIIDKIFPDKNEAEKAKIRLLELQQSGELAKLQNEIAIEQEITKRWQADMSSDSWLSKNIRPMALLIILAGYFTFAGLSAFDIDTNSAYVELLGQWGQIVMLAYFSGRSIEKGVDLWTARKFKDSNHQ